MGHGRTLTYKHECWHVLKRSEEHRQYNGGEHAADHSSANVIWPSDAYRSA